MFTRKGIFDTHNHENENELDQQRENNWDFMFKLHPTSEELATAARLFAAHCWELNSMDTIQAIRYTPESLDSQTSQEVPGQEGDNTWLVTNGERRAWITRYGPDYSEIPIWCVNVDENL